MFIWHCPDEECKERGTILFKTKCPTLSEGVIRCHKCKKTYSFKQLEKSNKKNVKKYFNELCM